MDKSIYDLGLHEGMTVTVEVDKDVDITYRITRVPGGWIYRNFFRERTNTVFVPYSDEFKK